MKVRVVAHSYKMAGVRHMQGAEIDVSEADYLAVEGKGVLVSIEAEQRAKEVAQQPSENDLRHQAAKQALAESERIRAGALQARLAENLEAHAQRLRQKGEIEAAAAERKAQAIQQQPQHGRPRGRPPLSGSGE